MVVSASLLFPCRRRSHLPYYSNRCESRPRQRDDARRSSAIGGHPADMITSTSVISATRHVTLHGATGMSQFEIHPAIITRRSTPAAKHSRIRASTHRTSAGNFSKGAPSAGAKRASSSSSRSPVTKFSARIQRSVEQLHQARSCNSLSYAYGALESIRLFRVRFSPTVALYRRDRRFHEAFCKLPRMIRAYSRPCLGTRPAMFSPLVCVYLEPREQFPELI